MDEKELLFTHVLKCERADLYKAKNRALTPEQSSRIADALRRRASGEPLNYILGMAWFMGHEFLVDENVLIPRPETELLVEAAVQHSAYVKIIMDAGTGCGNIAISLAKALPAKKVIATDISERALEVARKNAELNKACVSFVRCDMLDCFPPESCDMVVSNPPYVVRDEIDGLQPEVRREPRGALDGGKDGLDFYRKLAWQAPACLGQDGLLLVEIGCGQGDSVRKILEEGGFRILETRVDFARIERVIVAQKG
jgi:release factor glutamine methyltransferase